MSEIEVIFLVAALNVVGLFLFGRMYNAYDQRTSRLEGRIKKLETWTKREDRRRINKLESELKALEKQNPAQRGS